MKKVQSVMQVCLVVFAVALMSFDATARTIHKKEGQYLDMDGILTTFSGLVRYNDDMEEEYFSMTLTNWFGKQSAFFDGNVFLSWIYENQVTFLEGECKVPSGNGVNPAGYIWDDYGGGGRYLYQDTGKYNIYGDKIYERSHVLDGFSDPENSGALVRPCDRPSDAVSHLRPVWRSIPKWTNKDGDVSFAYIGNEGFDVLPDREEGWDEDEGGIQWSPMMWTTDGPKFKLDIKAEFPCYWKNDKLIYYTRSIPYTVTLVVWSDPRDGIPPGEEYYNKLAFSGTATANGKSYDEYFSSTYNLGERLRAGRYYAYMEIRSPLSRTAPSYCTREFEVRPKNLSIKVKPKAADWQTGSLTLHWRDASLADDVSDKESDNVIDVSGKRFNIWRANGEGYKDFANAKLVGVNQAGALWTDEQYAENLGVWPAKYWVQILSGNEEDLTAKPSSAPPASCITGRRFAILCGYDKYEPMPNGDENPAHSHTIDEVEWMHEALTNNGMLEKEFDCRNEKGTVAGLRNAWSAAFGETIPGDVLFFYISTHGGAAANNQSCTWLQTWETKAKEGGKGTGYESAIMREDIKRFDVDKGVKVINIIDACFSGAMYEDNKDVNTANTAWICSSTKDQLSDCVATVSQFAQTFVKWGWIDGCADLGKLENDSANIYRNSSAEDGVLNLWEIANYSQALVAGGAWQDGVDLDKGINLKHKQTVRMYGENLLRNTVVGNGVSVKTGNAPRRCKLTKRWLFANWSDADVIWEYKYSYLDLVFPNVSWADVFNDIDHFFYDVEYTLNVVDDKSYIRATRPNTGEIQVMLFDKNNNYFSEVRENGKVVLDKNGNPARYWKNVYGNCGHAESETLGKEYVPLEMNATYICRIRGVNRYGFGPWSEPIVFETRKDGKNEEAIQVSSSSDSSVSGLTVAVVSQEGEDVGVEVAVSRKDGSKTVYEGSLSLDEGQTVLSGSVSCGEDTLAVSITKEGLVSASSDALTITGQLQMGGKVDVSEFLETEITVDDGGTVEVRVSGGNADKASSVQVYLTYNTAAAADIDLKTGAIDGETPKGGLKSPLTLSWAKGEVGEKVISIPIKTDKTVEGDEFFTLQLANAQGMELGENRVCTMTIHDSGYDELAAKIADGTATKAEKAAWEKLQKAKAPYVRGLADPADGGKVTGSGLCDKGKKVTLRATANRNFTFLGWRQETGNVEQGTGNGFVATTPSLVIDRTAKPVANSKASTTITNIAEDVTYYAVFKSYPEVFVTVDATDGKGSEPTGKGAGKYVAGTITGMGKYAIGKTKIALKATANKGYVFSGWYDADGELLTKDATYTIAAMGEGDVEYTAKFITSGEDKAAIRLSVAGEALPGVSARTNYCGVAVNWQLSAEALSATTIKVTGLPSGLKFTAKPVTSKVGSGKAAVVVTNVPANTAYGAPTAASKADRNGKVTPSRVVFTVTTAGKSSQTYQIDMVVEALPAWASGKFDGGSGSGQAQLTVAANGKLSGKYMEGGVAYTLAAGSYSSYADGSYYADVTASWSYKDGKATVKASDVWTLSVGEGAVGGVVESDRFDAWQNLWSQKTWKDLGTQFFGKNGTTMTLSGEAYGLGEGESVELAVKANGTVTAKGVFGKVSASGSAVVCAESAEPFRGKVFVYFAPNPAKGFAGYVRVVDIGNPN